MSDMEQLTFKLDVFEGPLELLLHLIQKNKVSIYDIPINTITEQYFEYIEEVSAANIELSSEFLVVAAQLLYIKSKMLLPSHDDEGEEDPRKELVDRLAEYKKYKDAAAVLAERQFGDLYIYVRQRAEKIDFAPLQNIELSIPLEKLLRAFGEVAERNERKSPPPRSSFAGLAVREKVSIHSMVRYIHSLFKATHRQRFEDVFKGAKSRSVLVATFLAVLEMLKLNLLRLEETKSGLIFMRGSGRA